MNRPWTGVGARRIAAHLLGGLRGVARELEQRGYTLRSGGADGCDAAFETGLKYPQRAEIFLPFRGFNGHTSAHVEIPRAAFELAAQHHPRWSNLSGFAKRCHARSCQQVLGAALDYPSLFVVLWTPAGRRVGGTAQAWRIADAHGVPVFNLATETGKQKLTFFTKNS